MKNKLRLLNIVLLILIGAVGYRARETWTAARAREAQVLKARIPSEKAAPLQPLPAYAAVVSSNYIDVATKMLFSRDRNSNVIYPPPSPAPAPPPMPALPKYYGIMGFGTPGIILSEKPGAQQRTYRPGERVGEFQLVSFDREKVTFDWGGKKIESALDALVDRSSAPTNVQNVAAQVAQAVQPQASVASSPKGPGADIGGGYRACQANDSNTNGAISDGYRKAMGPTPFGTSCRWEPVK